MNNKREKVQPKVEPKIDIEDLPVFEKRVWRLFGIPVFSVTREVEENTLIDRMSKKIWLSMHAELRRIGAKG